MVSHLWLLPLLHTSAVGTEGLCLFSAPGMFLEKSQANHLLHQPQRLEFRAFTEESDVGLGMTLRCESQGEGALKQNQP